MIQFRAELHIHTVLSACAGIEMVPPIIVSEAIARGINLIAITDHNASTNAGAVMRAALNTNLTVLPGIELETAEEVHMVCLFPDLEKLAKFQSVVDQNLPPRKNNELFFGAQLEVDSEGSFIRKDRRFLSTSTSLSIEEATVNVTECGGKYFPAHIEREENGILARLGRIPNEIVTPILEISRFTTPEKVLESHPELASKRFIQGGDVHYINDLLGAVIFESESKSLEDIWTGLAISSQIY